MPYEPDNPPPTPPPCAGPHRALEARVWAAAVELDTAVVLGRRLATRPAPTVAEAHDLAAGLACAADSLGTVVRNASGDVAGLAVMAGEAAGPALEVAAALESARRLLEVVAEILTGAAMALAVAADVPPFPPRLAGPVPARPMRIVAVV